jgi:peptidoglycan/xylan/chitin deacetylase (PgdA/CDA1 family)
MKGFVEWLENHDKPVTLFVIADSLEDEEFSAWLAAIINKFSHRVTIGCHGLDHKSWSAWPENPDLFKQSMDEAIKIISDFAKGNYRPWFRAPAGYMAPWMIKPLSECGIIVDSSINDSILTGSKSGRGNTWQQVRNACNDVGVIEREWLTKWKLPVNGPALTKFPLSVIARYAWKSLPRVITPDNLLNVIEDKNQPVSTVYWHILDHSRNQGKWQPPIPQSILNH